MVKVKSSPFLGRIKSELKEIVRILENNFDYASVLGVDTGGYRYRYSGSHSGAEESMWTDRGFTARVFDGGRVFEYSFNMVDRGSARTVAKNIVDFAEKFPDEGFIAYPPVKEEMMKFSFTEEVKIDPSAADPEHIFSEMRKLHEKSMGAGEYVFDARVVYEWVSVSKVFVSSLKDLEQSYIWSQAYLVPMVRKDDLVKSIYGAASGLGGVEILKSLDSRTGSLVRDAESLLFSKPVVPGEYEVVCSPDIAGLIAHEAFGHGVEMDMFVKNRALGSRYIGRQVASSLVNMRDAAVPVRQSGSYHFDDEGCTARNTVIIENGILKQGISDLLSALYLGTEPTGNGRRQSYLNKAYSRMTNTYFESGEDSVDDMIASVKHGYFLDYTQSGMEDPKNWGLQAVAVLGKEIRDGKFTGEVVSPVVMTGYVPDILKNITMMSAEVELSGSGYCGKGWKEFVKVSSGGPYIKTRMRLG